MCFWSCTLAQNRRHKHGKGPHNETQNSWPHKRMVEFLGPIFNRISLKKETTPLLIRWKLRQCTGLLELISFKSSPSLLAALHNRTVTIAIYHVIWNWEVSAKLAPHWNLQWGHWRLSKSDAGRNLLWKRKSHISLLKPDHQDKW